MKILLMAPSGGYTRDEAARARWCGSVEHEITVAHSNASGDNFNATWAHALAGGRIGNFDMAVCQHADLDPWPDVSKPRWIDVLARVCLEHDAHLVSVATAIKDMRGLCSCGVGGNPRVRWAPLRRVTVKELDDLPETFNAADYGYPDKPILHNTGCYIVDLRKPVWYKGHPNGPCAVYFDYRHSLRWAGDAVIHEQQSEDWQFSEDLHKIGARTFITRAVRTIHYDGSTRYTNWGGWGLQDHDEEFRKDWEPIEQRQAA